MKGDEKMNRFNKKVMATILTLCLTFVSFCSFAADAAEITPLYNNVNTATANASITDNGKLTINYTYAGFSGVTTKAVITTYIEKKVLGLFWTRVDIGTTNDEWIDTIYNYRHTGSRTFQLSSSGTYRVTVTFVIFGSGGKADEIEKQKTISY